MGPRLLAQPLGEDLHRRLGGRVDALRRLDGVGRGGADGDEVPGALAAEERQGGRDAVEEAGDVGRDHGVPVVLAQVVERRDGHRARVGDEHVESAEPVDGGVRQPPEVLAAGDVDEDAGGGAAPRGDAVDDRVQPVLAAGAEDEQGAAFGEVGGGRLADAAAGTRDRDDLAPDSRHGRPSLPGCAPVVGRRRVKAGTPPFRRRLSGGAPVWQSDRWPGAGPGRGGTGRGRNEER